MLHKFKLYIASHTSQATVGKNQVLANAGPLASTCISAQTPGAVLAAVYPFAACHKTTENNTPQPAKLMCIIHVKIYILC